MDVAKTTPPVGPTPAEPPQSATSLSASAVSNAPANATGEDETAANPTGRQFAISGGGYRAVVTEVGAGLRELGHHGNGTLRPLVLGFGEQETVRSGAGPTRSTTARNPTLATTMAAALVANSTA